MVVEDFNFTAILKFALSTSTFWGFPGAVKGKCYRAKTHFKGLIHDSGFLVAGGGFVLCLLGTFFFSMYLPYRATKRLIST